MVLTKQRKVSLGILGIALCGLAADRMLLGGAPATAAAAEAEAPRAPVIGPSSAILPSKPGLAARLEALADRRELDPSSVGDLFASAAKPPQWRLTGMVGYGERATVTIDAVRVRVGEQHGGATLLRTTPEGAVFEQDGSEFLVRFATPEAWSERPQTGVRGNDR